MSQYQPQNQNPSFLDVLWRYKFHLAFYVILISFASFTFLYILGGVPKELVLQEPLPIPPVVQSASVGTTTEEVPIYPLRVIIDKIGVNTPVSNPTSVDATLLNNELLKGAVRYPGSGTVGKGNMFIFGHSTGIRVVNNQAYKAFNNLRSLEIGDTIHIQSADTSYNYKVTSVSLVDSNEALVTFSQDKNMLTLSTCDVFGQKQDRYVVEATFVKATPLE